MVYGDFKDLTRRTCSDKIIRDKTFNIAKNRKHDGHQRGLASMGYNLFVKKIFQWSNENMTNKELAKKNTQNKDYKN